MAEENKKEINQLLTIEKKEENKKDKLLATPSIVIKEIAGRYGGELEYKKENGIKKDGTIYQSQSWIWRSQNKQKEIPILVKND